MKKYIVWFLIIIAVFFLWFSLRDESKEEVYALVALGIWGVAFLIDRYWPK
jgi:hypothetical protein